MTAVVRGSTGEPVILLRGDALGDVPEATLIDLARAAVVVLSDDELRTVGEMIPRLRYREADRRVSVDGTLLNLYRLTDD